MTINNNDQFKGMFPPQILLDKYPKAKELRNLRDSKLTASVLGTLVNWGILKGTNHKFYGGCLVDEESFISFIESRGIELTESPQPF